MNRAFLTLVVASIGASSLVACSGKAGSVETPAEAFARVAPPRRETMPADAPEPAAYRVTFHRYTRGDADGHLLKAERLRRVVTRPFSETIGGATRTLAFVAESPGAASRVVPLRPLADDPRPRVYASATGSRRTRVVAGRACRDYRDGDATYCVDAAGLVLASNDGRRVEVATKVVELGAPESPALLTQQLAAGFNDPNRGSVRPVDPNSSAPGVMDWSLPAPPARLTLVGRYAVVPLTDALLKRDSRQVSAGIVDVYVRGIDTVIVDRGGRLDKSDATDDLGVLTNQRRVDLGALGSGRVGIGGIGPFGYREVRATPSEGRYVVVAATIPEAELLTVARSLEAKPGTPLHYLDNS